MFSFKNSTAGYFMTALAAGGGHEVSKLRNAHQIFGERSL
jgi:hypothetical protein